MCPPNVVYFDDVDRYIPVQEMPWTWRAGLEMSLVQLIG
jgi:hypothetical protein